MIPFRERLPDVAGREMLVLRIQENGLPLPPGEYGFFEWFCEDAGCDCRRALLQVISPQHPGRIVATINYGWESAAFYTEWMHGDAEAGRDITSASLDPINPQSELADALLEGFREYLRRDSTYPQQLQRHYELFKGAEKKTRPTRPVVASSHNVFPPMTTEEILRQLQHVPKKTDFAPYKAALLAAAEQREAIIPELIAALDRVSANPAQYRKKHDESLHLFAIYLLAQFRERRALDAFLRFFSLPGEDALHLTSDMVTEHGAAVLASVCGGDPAPLLQLARNESVNEYVRGQAIDGLIVQSLWGERPREAAVADLRDLFSSLTKPGDGYLWASLVGAACDFNAPELLPEIRQAFAEELVDDGIITLEDAEDLLLQTDEYSIKDSEQNLACLRQRHAPIDAVNECSVWLCFRDEDEYDHGSWPEPGGPADRPAEPLRDWSPPTPYVAPPKVGRNDPCPCGSGKKYKKCCGKN